MSLTDNLDKSIKDIENNFTGGLSNTSTRKFNALSVAISAITGLPEDDIYITSVYARPSNTWNRLSQGKPLSRHYTLGVCIASPDGVNGVLSPLWSFIGSGNIHYDSIAVIAQDMDGIWKIMAIATNAKDLVSIKCQDQYPDAFIKLINVVAHPRQEVVSRAINPEAALIPRGMSAKSILAPLQLITYGAPGTGKSWDVRQETQGRSCIRTTFHPDSDYSTFVGAYKPTMEEVPRTALVGKKIELAEGSSELLKEKRIVYRFVAQAFLEAYVAAWRKCSGFLSAQDEDEKAANVQFLVIEEINRGNCAQIFGDIFQLLDREDDRYSAYAIKADSDLRQYLEEAFQSLDLAGVDLGNRDVTPEEIKSGEKMLLPPNLLIRATMNTSDQSLFPMDSAFKRRWDWKYVPIRNHPEEDYRIAIGGETYRWWPFITEINKRIVSATESEDKKLGYFFVKAEKGSDGKNVIDADKFLNKVVFYLWNDVFKNSEPEKAFKFERPDGKKDIAAFQDFFKEEDGSRDDGMLKAFLKGLGVEAVAEETQENAAGSPASPGEESPAPAALPPGAAE